MLRTYYFSLPERNQPIDTLAIRAYLAPARVAKALRGWWGWLALGVIMGGAAYIRFWAAPLSTGPDVAQFAVFAQVFHQHGLDFYRYADASLDIFPFSGWGFVYPPVWLLILGLVWLASPAGVANNVVIDAGWRLAVKTPIILGDLAIGVLLYWAVPGPKWRKLVFAAVWLLHPTAWYNSAVFGQFDAVATAFLLAAVILLLKGRDRLAFLLAALAVMTKQHVFLAIGTMVVAVARHLGKRRLLGDGAIAVGVAVVLSIPFLVTGNFLEYARSVFLPGTSPDYQNPLCYAFGGGAAIITYLHNSFGWNISALLTALVPVTIIAWIVTAVFCYRRAITPLQAALAGILVFIALFYRVNYQYLVVYIPLALLLAARTQYRGERVFALVLALFPALWMWLFNTPWWFYVYKPVSYEGIMMLERFGLLARTLPDYAYVAFAGALMCLCLAYVVLMFVRWRQPSGYKPLEG